MAEGARLERWMDEEVSLCQEHSPLTADEEIAYRDAMGKTLHAAQLRVADSAGDLGDAVLIALKRHSDAARDRSLREFFRRFW